ncbi:xaa-Pro aminopeptidase 1-like [Strongylocentrotus purpuratus]|uniref:Xaa-Pro aminopeptidase 1 n=1 Tax=Strongylocentrotus purpuratus TaxID=7668 RepID=A0A7M7NTK0_STRPU|nr:xaa-Pro aminopeptidase 1-like [Strongylocentrotus purpuratus]
MAKNTTLLLQKLRGFMQSSQYGGPIQAYIIPSCDSHQNEYIAECDCRRPFITGFTGSSGTAIVTEMKAAMWTDGRYFLQAAKQMDQNWTLMKMGMPKTPTQEEWLTEVLPAGSKVGVDPFLFRWESWKTFSSTLEGAGHSLVPIQSNLVDLVWDADRPLPPQAQVKVHSLHFTGQSSAEKVAQIRRKMAKVRVQNLILTALDEIAWLFNLRGSDIVYNPVFFAYAVLSQDSVHLFVDESKLEPGVHSHINQGIEVTLHAYDDIQKFISDMLAENGAKTWISANSSYALMNLIPKQHQYIHNSPIWQSKAVKNDVEIEGMRQAHIRDAVALCEYFNWLEHEIPKGYLNEVTAADKLENLRSEQEDFVSLSFDTISSMGPNGAVIHYKPQLPTALTLNTQEIYLCDSGGQYRDGTTDVTRTFHFGTPTQHQKECFTRVLKGVISLATAVFPEGTRGVLLDSFARQHLWEIGLDYMHGTGHGIGSYLNVHEPPHLISYRVGPGSEAPLEAGIFMSDEPGYYEDGSFGIRIENIVLAVPANTKYSFSGKKFVTFETVTLAPIQLKMIDPSLLTEKEIKWVNDYHSQCQEIVGAELGRQGREEALKWLIRETQQIG